MHRSAIQDLLEGIAARAERDMRPISPDVEARVLLDLVQVVCRPIPFGVGDLVTLRKGFELYKIPAGVAVVTHVFDAPFLAADGSASDMRNDMLIMIRDADGNVVEHGVQSWRFDAYTGEIA